MSSKLKSLLIEANFGKDETEFVQSLGSPKLSYLSRIVVSILSIIPQLKNALDRALKPIVLDVRSSDFPWIETDEFRKVVLWNFPLSISSINIQRMDRVERALRNSNVVVIANPIIFPELLWKHSWSVVKRRGHTF